MKKKRERDEDTLKGSYTLVFYPTLYQKLKKVTFVAAYTLVTEEEHKKKKTC